jgi:hypothetical protein
MADGKGRYSLHRLTLLKIIDPLLYGKIPKEVRGLN